MENTSKASGSGGDDGGMKNASMASGGSDDVGIVNPSAIH